MAITNVPLSALLQAALAVGVLAAILFTLAPGLAEFLIRFRLNRLPPRLSERFAEEWIAEVRAMPNRARKLSFAVALAVMRTSSLEDAEDGLAFGSGTPVVLSVEDVRVYSEFFSRFWALVIDSMLAIALSFVVQVALRGTGPGPTFNVLFGTVWLAVMQVYCVTRFGGTPGKLLLKMRIVTMNGEPLTPRHALLRAAPDYGLSLLGALVVIWAMAQVGEPALDAATAAERQRLILSAIPLWITWPLRACQVAWFVCDLAVFIDSYERRALHDLIAGTVVVYKVPHVVGTLTQPPPTRSTSAYR